MSLWSNVSRPGLSDPRVRRAIGYAIDREAVSKVAFFGYGLPLYGLPLPEDGPYSSAEIARYDFDLDKAKTLRPRQPMGSADCARVAHPPRVADQHARRRRISESSGKLFRMPVSSSPPKGGFVRTTSTRSASPISDRRTR
ncbi:ABC transporter substrate-binding protein [Paracoccus mutanolyticus]|uniref:ABC transporter substrate-binding protein n=1 Tax=Paracoccus mutanolyticus TaxID=1499308 RepID=UPI001CB9497B|nr:ABC transporter substrate-binding protein [Paracoccus mutanolyticus]